MNNITDEEIKSLRKRAQWENDQDTSWACTLALAYGARFFPSPEQRAEARKKCAMVLAIRPL